MKILRHIQDKYEITAAAVVNMVVWQRVWPLMSNRIVLKWMLHAFRFAGAIRADLSFTSPADIPGAEDRSDQARLYPINGVQMEQSFGSLASQTRVYLPTEF